MALAVKVVDWPGCGLEFVTVRLIELGVPSLTVTLVVAALTVPIAALMVVVQTPETPFAGITKPVEPIVAQLLSLELHSTLPVRSLVLPSL
jgi:hypothetical protein